MGKKRRSRRRAYRPRLSEEEMLRLLKASSPAPSPRLSPRTPDFKKAPQAPPPRSPVSVSAQISESATTYLKPAEVAALRRDLINVAVFTAGIVLLFAALWYWQSHYPLLSNFENWFADLLFGAPPS